MTRLADRVADLERENAELRGRLTAREAELREALQQQTATAEVLGVINSSRGDLTPVFDAMLEKAMRLCEAAFGIANIYDGERFHTAALRGVPEPLAELWRSDPPSPAPQSPLARILNGEDVAHIEDFATSPGYLKGEPRPRAMVELGGAHSYVAVALRKNGKLLGTLGAYRQEVRPFTDKQIALLQNFAAQAVIAMENARLITETREALEQQTATAEVLGVINSSPGDLAPVFDAMLEKAHALCGAATGSLQLDDGEFVRAVATRGLPDEFVKILRQPRRTAFRDAFLRGAPFVQIADLANPVLTGGDETTAAGRDIAGVRTLLRVPLRKDNALLGWIVAGRREVRPFTDKQIALLQNFAAQAVIAMENARLITETREALEQQTATAEVLGVINSSPGDLAPVFDAMLEKATTLCEAAHGALFIQDGDRFRAIPSRSTPTVFAEFLTREPIYFDPERSIMGRTLQQRSAVQVSDMRESEPYRNKVPIAVMAVETAGTRTLLSVPMFRESTPAGIFQLARREVRPFNEKEIALVSNFAAQAVIAIENTRLISETREALEQQTATAEVLGVINSSPGYLEPVFEAMLEKAMRLCEAAFGQLAVYADGRFRTAATRGMPPAFVEYRRGNPPDFGPHTLPGRLLAGAHLLHVADLKSEAAYQQGEPNRRALVDLGGVRTALMVPLLHDDAVRGFISVYRQEIRPFTDKQIALLQNFADQAVIAMENARLLGELRERTDEVAELNRGLEARVAEQVEELGRVGRLKRFLAPQLAELIVSQGDEKILESHRREIVVVFCDLRGYTAFTETAEPEEVLDFLREYHGALGPLVAQFEGTLDQFSGDGIMVFFNDPVPIPDPAERAVKMAVAMREAAGQLIAAWRERGRDLGFGAGIAQGYATLGQIGFSERSGYTAIGTVCNVAARLCAEAKDGQILLSQRVNAALQGSVATEQVGALALKGLTQPVMAYNVPLVSGQAAFRVIEGGAPE